MDITGNSVSGPLASFFRPRGGCLLKKELCLFICACGVCLGIKMSKPAVEHVTDSCQ